MELLGIKLSSNDISHTCFAESETKIGIMFWQEHFGSRTVSFALEAYKRGALIYVESEMYSNHKRIEEEVNEYICEQSGIYSWLGFVMSKNKDDGKIMLTRLKDHFDPYELIDDPDSDKNIELINFINNKFNLSFEEELTLTMM